MNETVFGMNIVIYLTIGVIYALYTINRHHRQQDNKKTTKDDKISLFFILSIFWVGFVISDIIALSKSAEVNPEEPYVIKENEHIPLGIIHDKLLQYGFPKPTTVLLFPHSNSNSILEYRGNFNLIQNLIKHKSIPIVASYCYAFETLVYNQYRINNISLYLVFHEAKFLGVFAIVGDIRAGIANLEFHFYYGNSIPYDMDNSLNLIK